MVILVLQPFYSQDKKPIYPVDTQLDETKRQAVGSEQHVFLCHCAQYNMQPSFIAG
jgi:hypothetical protein